MSAASPKPAALWSHPAAPCSRPSLSTTLLGCVLLVCLLAEMATDGESLLSSHNGMLIKFGKSLHSINFYWFRTRYISRTVFGCFVLKFIGSTLVSLVLLGRPPSWYLEPHQLICFLLAFSMVRSDSLEARELSSHMRYAAPATIALNFVAALHKMRSLVHLAELRPTVGWPAALGVGTLAFSACNALMAAEAYCLHRAAALRACRDTPTASAESAASAAAASAAAASAAAASAAAASAAAASAAAASPGSVRTPCIRTTLCRHACSLALLLAAQPMGSRLGYALAKVLVLGVLFRGYNDGLLLLHAAPTAPPPSQPPAAPVLAPTMAPAPGGAAFPPPPSTEAPSPHRWLLRALGTALALAPGGRRAPPRLAGGGSSDGGGSTRRYGWLGARAAVLYLLGLASTVGPVRAAAPSEPAGARRSGASIGTSLLAPRAGGEAARRSAGGAGAATDREGLGLHCRASLLQPRARPQAADARCDSHTG